MDVSQRSTSLVAEDLDVDTQGEQDKFVMDAQKLTDDIIAPDGAMGHVRALLNVWGVFVPSNTVRAFTCFMINS